MIWREIDNWEKYATFITDRTDTGLVGQQIMAFLVVNPKCAITVMSNLDQSWDIKTSVLKCKINK